MSIKFKTQLLLLGLLKIMASHSAEQIFDECKYNANGSFVAIEHNCIAYIYCNGTESFTDICPFGTYFNGETQECDFDEDGLCQNPLTATTTTATTIISSASSINTLFVPTTSSVLNGRPKCTNTDTEVYFPHTQRCEYFYKCVGTGFLTIMRCNTDFLWDYERQECLPANMAKCFRQKRRTDIITN